MLYICILHVPVGTAAAYFQHSQYRKRLGHCHHDDSFPCLPRVSLRLPCPAGLPTPKPHLLMIAFFCGLHLPFRRVSPLELMPWYWQAAHYVFPVAPQYSAFVKLNSMGGSLADIWPQMLTLWIQVIIYGAWAVYTTRRVYKRSNIKTGDIEGHKKRLSIPDSQSSC